MKLKRPKVLQKNDPVHVVASSSPFSQKGFLKGIGKLKSFGLKPKYRKDIFSREAYLAGSDERRFQELKNALADKNAKAIFFARGGYGAARLIEKLSFVKPELKILAGFSDVTTLLLYAQKKWGWVTFYSPMVGGSLYQDRLTLNSFQKTVFSRQPLGALEVPDLVSVRPGKAEGVLVGGCLTLIAHSLGTPYQIETKDRILFLEDVDEKPYEIDRMLTHLKLAGLFEKCRGVLFGSLPGPNPLNHYKRVLREIFADYSFPVVMNFPGGHCKRRYTLPFGVQVELDTRRKTLTYLEAALQ